MIDIKFNQGIQNAVQVCMNVKEDDRVFIITDQETLEIGEALSRESANAGSQASMVKLEGYGERPFTSVPEELIQDIVNFKPTVTFFAASGKEGEVKMRMEMSLKSKHAFAASGLPAPRHGHMISITPRLIREGMTADYVQINKLTHEVTNLVKDAQTIHVSSAKGSDLTVLFNPDYKWVPCHGLYHQPGDWGNLPEGEVFTCPDKLNGTLVADVLGDYFSPKFGVLDTPVTFAIKDSLVEKVSCENNEIAREVWGYLNSAENGRRWVNSRSAPIPRSLN